MSIATTLQSFLSCSNVSSSSRMSSAPLPHVSFSVKASLALVALVALTELRVVEGAAQPHILKVIVDDFGWGYVRRIWGYVRRICCLPTLTLPFAAIVTATRITTARRSVNRTPRSSHRTWMRSSQRGCY